MTPDLSLAYGTGGHGAGRVHRLVRGALSLVLVAGSAGCATKGDIRDVRDDVAVVSARQDSIIDLLEMQNRQILDSLQVTTEELLNVRGQLTNQLTQLNDQLVQIGQLTGQVQIRLNQFDQQLAAVAAQLQQVTVQPGGGQSQPEGGDDNSFSMAQQFYEIGLEQRDLGNSETARRAFRSVVDSFPDNPVAPEALRLIGETFIQEGDFDLALDSFDEVVRRYQDSDAAPRALYRAGVIAEQQGNPERAREYFQRVVSGYPNSDARRLAESALERLGG